MQTNPLIVILGPTASGKTTVAVDLCSMINGEVISADSRQVYKKMNIGTGKDLEEYVVNNKPISYHLIDIVEPGYQYNVYEYQTDFYHACNLVRKKGNIPVLCGGSGMYIEAVVEGYKLIQVPINKKLRDQLTLKSMDELKYILSTYKTLHNTTDTENKKRLIRAIEIAEYEDRHHELKTDFPVFNTLLFGIAYDRKTQRQRITERLHQRLRSGMIEEVKQLMDEGITKEQLIYYGLEYKYITLYLTGNMQYDEMVQQLNTAIHQFAKRQMTWFRRMERKGNTIHWIDGHLSLEEKTQEILNHVKSYI